MRHELGNDLFHSAADFAAHVLHLHLRCYVLLHDAEIEWETQTEWVSEIEFEYDMDVCMYVCVCVYVYIKRMYICVHV